MSRYVAPLAAEVRAHQAEALRTIVLMPRAAPHVTDDDARQLVNALYSSLLESLEGRGAEERELFIADAVPEYLAAGATLSGLVRGMTRAFVVLIAESVPRLPDEVRADATRWLGTFVSNFVAEVVERSLEARSKTE